MGVDRKVSFIADNIQLYPEELYEWFENNFRAHLQDQCFSFPPALRALIFKQYIAKIEAKRVGFLEALMLTIKVKTGGTRHCSLFAKVCSTPFWMRVLRSPGQLRWKSPSKWEFRKRAGFNQKDLWIADECFLTGSAAVVIPCVEVDHRPISDGKPGEVTLKLINLFRESVKKDGIRLDGAE